MSVSLARRILARRLVSPEQLHRALFESLRSATPLLQTLIEGRRELALPLSELVSGSHPRAPEDWAPDKSLLATLPPGMCERLLAFPISAGDGGEVEVAAADPGDPHVVREFVAHLGRTVLVVAAPLSQVLNAVGVLVEIPAAQVPRPLSELPIPLVRRSSQRSKQDKGPGSSVRDDAPPSAPTSSPVGSPRRPPAPTRVSTVSYAPEPVKHTAERVPTPLGMPPASRPEAAISEAPRPNLAPAAGGALKAVSMPATVRATPGRETGAAPERRTPSSAKVSKTPEPPVAAPKHERSLTPKPVSVAPKATKSVTPSPGAVAPKPPTSLTPHPGGVGPKPSLTPKPGSVGMKPAKSVTPAPARVAPKPASSLTPQPGAVASKPASSLMPQPGAVASKPASSLTPKPASVAAKPVKAATPEPPPASAKPAKTAAPEHQPVAAKPAKGATAEPPPVAAKATKAATPEPPPVAAKATKAATPEPPPAFAKPPKAEAHEPSATVAKPAKATTPELPPVAIKAVAPGVARAPEIGATKASAAQFRPAVPLASKAPAVPAPAPAPPKPAASRLRPDEIEQRLSSADHPDHVARTLSVAGGAGTIIFAVRADQFAVRAVGGQDERPELSIARDDASAMRVAVELNEYLGPLFDAPAHTHLHPWIAEGTPVYAASVKVRDRATLVLMLTAGQDEEATRSLGRRMAELAARALEDLIVRRKRTGHP